MLFARLLLLSLLLVFCPSGLTSAAAVVLKGPPPAAPPVGTTIEILAAGRTGSETMRLRIDNQFAAGWNNVGGNPVFQQYRSFIYETDEVVTADQIRVFFANGDDPARNLRVDAILINGVRYETEHQSVFSTGTENEVGVVVPGFPRSEYLNATGYFQYASVRSNVVIRGYGETGEENMTLTIRGDLVREWSGVNTVKTNYGYTSPGTFTIDQVRVEFTNAIFIPGVKDRNLFVDFVKFDGSIYQAESPAVFSTGTFLPGAGIVPRYAESEVLHGNGYFHFGSEEPPAGQGATTVGFDFEFDVVDEDAGIYRAELIRTGDLSGEAWVDFQTRDDTATAGDDYSARNNRVVFFPGQSNRFFNIPIRDDSIDEPLETLDVALTDFSRGVVLGSKALMLTIIDNDDSPPSGTFYYNGHLYRLTDGLETWDEAQVQAQAAGGYLAAISDQAEQNWLNGTFGTTEKLWIGLNDRDVEGEFRWSNGESVGYTYWARNQPDNAVGIEDFAAMNLYANGRWGDFSLETQFRGVIEIDESAPVNPSGAGFTPEPILDGLVQPSTFAFASDGRIFVAEKSGLVKVFENNTETTFVDLRDEVNSYHDRGLIGMALDPDFLNNGNVYLNYSVELNPASPDEPDFSSPSGGRLTRYSESVTQRGVADLSTRLVLLDGHETEVASHSVGDVEFDNDGNLVFAWGDGGFSDESRLHAQELDSKQGKLFRIDPSTGFGVPNNPYYDVANPDSLLSKLWAIGIRNTWRLSVDRASGDIYLGEVTDSGPEEVNLIPYGDNSAINFGWPYYQGNNPVDGYDPPPGFQYQGPWLELTHIGNNDAIADGLLYRGSAYPGIYDGRYFFSNIAQSVMYSADASAVFQQFMSGGSVLTPVDMQLGADGHIYVLSLFGGQLYKLAYDPESARNLPPLAVATATPTAGATPLSVQFDGQDSSDPDGEIVLYEWDFDADQSPDATSAAPSYMFTRLGSHQVTLTVTDNMGATTDTQLIVTVLPNNPGDGNQALGKSAILSSTDGPRYASYANNGSVNGPVARSLSERTPFWEVDLGAVSDLKRVSLFTDVDGNIELSDYYVLVSDIPFSSGNLDAVLNDPGIFIYYNSAAAGPRDDIPLNRTGRYVRIQRAGDDRVLSLAEVKVFEN